MLPKISKKKEEAVTLKFSTKISKGIKSILNNTLINQKLETKREYLREHLEIDEIPEIFDVKNWVQFLPPLVPIKMKQVSNISSSFKNVFMDAMKKGNKTQSMQLNTLRGKIIAFSLHIQELIQKVVRREAPLLKNLSDEPMLENACCNETKNNFNYYFNKVIKPTVQQNGKRIGGYNFNCKRKTNISLYFLSIRYSF